jgi:antitoxin ParD1/3/4
MSKLTHEQQAWLESHIASGEFASADEALSQLISERILAESDDMSWAKPYVDQATTSVARGEALTLETHKARNAERLAAIGE